MMLSFPAQSWKTALQYANSKARRGGTSESPGLRYGRVASQITPRLYLSDYWTACDEEEIKRLGITHIISVIEHRPALPDSIPISRRLQVFIADRSDANLLIHFDETTNFIIAALAEDEAHKVLVHCMQGISRSAAVVCAYLVATKGMESHESIDHVQSIRGIVCPNLGFRLQLVQYSNRFPKEKKKEKGKSTKIREDIVQHFRKLIPSSNVVPIP